MSFSIAAAPLFFTEQHKHPFASSKNSSDPSPGLFSAVETLIDFAGMTSSIEQS
jgi:hypothetical protein